MLLVSVYLTLLTHSCVTSLVLYIHSTITQFIYVCLPQLFIYIFLSVLTHFLRVWLIVGQLRVIRQFELRYVRGYRGQDCLLYLPVWVHDIICIIIDHVVLYVLVWLGYVATQDTTAIAYTIAVVPAVQISHIHIMSLTLTVIVYVYTIFTSRFLYVTATIQITGRS
jgi:hypothetical protein